VKVATSAFGSLVRKANAALIDLTAESRPPPDEASRAASVHGSISLIAGSAVTNRASIEWNFVHEDYCFGTGRPFQMVTINDVGIGGCGP
jgi:putative N-acetylmannosamine-6-phosphate epimerase